MMSLFGGLQQVICYQRGSIWMQISIWTDSHRDVGICAWNRFKHKSNKVCGKKNCLPRRGNHNRELLRRIHKFCHWEQKSLHLHFCFHWKISKGFLENWFDRFGQWIRVENELKNTWVRGENCLLRSRMHLSGKYIPCFCCCSGKGTIIGTFLQTMLEAVDKLEVFVWLTGLNPFLLLDDYGCYFNWRSWNKYSQGRKQVGLLFWAALCYLLLAGWGQ